MIPYRLLAGVFAVSVAGYVVLSYLNFQMPTTLAEAELCGFIADDFTTAGQLAYPPFDAWRVSFFRMQEYWVALSVGVSITFIVFALIVAWRARQNAAGAAAAAAGGGALALTAICVSCLAPALSAVGLGVATSMLADVPRWLMAANTLLLTGWGTMVLTRKLTSCPLPNRARAVVAE